MEESNFLKVLFIGNIRISKIEVALAEINNGAEMVTKDLVHVIQLTLFFAKSIIVQIKRKYYSF